MDVDLRFAGLCVVFFFSLFVALTYSEYQTKKCVAELASSTRTAQEIKELCGIRH